MKKKERKQYDDDDGRTIAPMNIPGMPWYVENPGRSRRKRKGQTDDAPMSPEEIYRQRLKEEDPEAYREMEKQETRLLMSASVKAVLVVAAYFVLGFLLFILFCYFVWFR